MAGNNTTVTNSQGQQFVVGKPVAFGVTPPIRDLPPEMRQAPASPKDEDERIENERQAARSSRGIAISPSWIRAGPGGAGARPAALRDACPVADLCRHRQSDWLRRLPAAGHQRRWGPNHSRPGGEHPRQHLQQDRHGWASGAVLQSAAFFKPAGNSCRNSDDGDPIVLYDSLADRWLVSQFEINDARWPPSSPRSCRRPIPPAPGTPTLP